MSKNEEEAPNAFCARIYQMMSKGEFAPAVSAVVSRDVAIALRERQIAEQYASTAERVLKDIARLAEPYV